ncbi:hypothetical protein [Marinicella rhabdoformis]|uniref:hypothetical protein n=1 Tax=Marinicella rhabdoformis TaxID=2580566 RepID=UPI0012AEBB31|nr:hypothetical protein [Marinicella rhabdoformis]
MYKRIAFSVLILFFVSYGYAGTGYENNIFVVTEQQYTFFYHDHMNSYLKEKKPRTFKIYSLLDEDAKRKVFVSHLKERQLDLTDIVLKVYKDNKN